jgi:two-component system cell cycle sensor histidine kinase/response regulator CckA
MELPATPSAPLARQAPDSAPKRVLVVDDEEEVRTLTARMLAAAGYRVATAAGALQALQLAESGTVRLVVTDLRMPGMSGEELAEHLRRRTPELPVLFMSGYTSARTGSGLPGPFLAKPFSQDDLLSQVERLLNGG